MLQPGSMGECRVPSLDYQAVRAAISLAQVLELVGFVVWKRRGDQLRGPCPIHDSPSSKSRTFSAHLGRNAYRCFKCGSQGNQLDLWAAVTNLDLHTATLGLCERLNVDVPQLHRTSPPRRRGNPSARTEKRNP